MSQLSTVISKIFKTYGYEIIRNVDYMNYILAKKEQITVSIGYATNDRKPGKKDIRTFIKTSVEDDANRSIFISVKDLGGDIKQLLESQNVEIWEREKLEREIGKALLGDLPELDGTGTGNFKTIVEPHIGTAAAEPERHEILVPFVLGEVPSTIAGERSEIIETGLNILPVKITREEAEILTRKIIRNFRFDLQLVPYYIFDYTCEVIESPRKKTRVNKGTLGINTLSNHIEEWPERIATVSKLNQEYTKLEPSFSIDEAKDRIKEAVIELNTRETETIEDKGTAIIIEKKKIKPKEDMLEINSRGTVFMPVWCVEGSNGLITIDATSGKILKEDIYKDKNISFL